MRFSLRGLFLLLTLCAAGCAWVAYYASQARAENRIVQQLQSAEDGRTIVVLYGNRFNHEEQQAKAEAFFTGGPAWAERLLGVDIVRTPMWLSCAPPGNTFRFEMDDEGQRVIRREYKSGMRTADLELIGRLNHLQQLRLEASPVDDEGLAHLAGSTNLRRLDLSHTAISDAGLVHLSRLPKLRTLDISRTDVSDASVETLAQFPALERLDVEMSRVTEQGVERLRRELPDCVISY